MEATLTPSTQPTSRAPISTSGRRHLAGSILTALAVLFLAFDAVMKLVKVPPVVEAMQRMGYPDGTARPIGLVLLACLAIHLVPRTAVLGAVLLTGYLGGAISAHVRLEDPLFSHTLFPIYVAALLWVGLYLRDARVRTIVECLRGRSRAS